MTRVRRQAWGSTLHITTRERVGPVWLEDLLTSEVERLDRAASRFRPDSQTTRICRAAGSWVPIDDYLTNLIGVAVDVAAATGGLVHPGLGQQVVDAGYDVWAGRETVVHGDSRVLPWQSIELSADHGVRIPPGMVLDLGSIAKAWLADRLALAVNAATGVSVLANMGGDLRIVGAAEPWPVTVDPQLGRDSRQLVYTNEGGLATSGLTRRRWAGGHHIIDPRTGRCAATPWTSVSVMAADAVGANAAATAALVLGEDAPVRLTEVGVDAVLVGPGRRVTVGRWPQEEAAA